MTRTRTPGRTARTPKPARRQPRASITLTGRGAVLALFAACFLGLLAAAWTGWSVLADVIFVRTCGVGACYTRGGGLGRGGSSPPPPLPPRSLLAQGPTPPRSFLAARGTPGHRARS